MLFVAGRFRLSADSRIQVSAIRVDYFEPQNSKPFSLQLAPQTLLRFRVFCGQDFFVSQNQKRIFSVLRCLGIFRVVTFQSKTGRFVARNFSRTRGKFDLRRGHPGRLPRPPSPPREKKTTAPPPARQNTGSFTKTLEFQRHFRR